MAENKSYVYQNTNYKDLEAEDPANTRGKYNTHRPHSHPTDAEFEPNNSKTKPAKPTPSRDFGPFYVQFGPFRGKLTPIHHIHKPLQTGEKAQPGHLLVVKGNIFGFGSQKGLSYATLDVWQASPSGAYDYVEKDGAFHPYLTYIGELNTHSLSKEYDFRARVLTDHLGRFEYETVIPPPYFDPEDSTWRCPHIHHFVQRDGHQSIVTQIMFPDMEKNDVDAHIRPDLIVPLTRKQHENGTAWWEANFDVFLVEENQK
eukprot:TRINITY_DN8978_c0_g1_i2.p1 TRINITY_DN8978_c0_g1~~TRINITY_DN8978_c0_g1_i2.p1  ORF type:complete len:258 (-),score=56.87 TRINITY_DN8978_c0_g1_i2:75-848(-)